MSENINTTNNNTASAPFMLDQIAAQAAAKYAAQHGGAQSPAVQAAKARTCDVNSYWDKAVVAFGSTVDMDGLLDPEKAAVAKACIIDDAHTRAEMDDQLRKDKLAKYFKRLDAYAASQLMLHTGDVGVIEPEEGGARLLAIRHHTGPYAGIWTIDTQGLGYHVKQAAINLGVDVKQISAVAETLMIMSPVIKVDKDPNLVPMCNGVLDLRTKDFTPYTMADGAENPDYVAKYGSRVITYKNAAEWDPQAADDVLTGPDGLTWSVEQHMQDVLGDNPAAINIWWQAANFALRGMSGGRSIWMMDHSENGAGGGAKSTTAGMIAAAVGQSGVCALDLDHLQGQFGLASLIGKRMIVGNESNAGAKQLENAAVIKSMMRGEPVQVDRKHKDIVMYTFRGLMIQCFNCAAPKISDKTGSFYRKIVAMPFSRRLGGATERRYIADDFIYRQSVINYIARKALELGPISRYNEDDLAALDANIITMRAAGSTVFGYMQEVAPTIAGDMIPLPALYACYGQWCKINGYNGCNSSNFESDLIQWIATRDDWQMSPAGAKPRRLPSDAPSEQMLADYGTLDWRQSKDPYNHDMYSGAGDWDRAALRKTARKWIERTPNSTQQAADARNMQLSRYREFCQAMTWEWVMRAGRTADETRQAVPDFDTWISMGQPVPRYLGDTPDTMCVDSYVSYTKRVEYHALDLSNAIPLIA